MVFSQVCGRKLVAHFSAKKQNSKSTSSERYSCDYSSKKFRAPSYLREHERIHTEEKPYSCEILHEKVTSSVHVTGNPIWGDISLPLCDDLHKILPL